MKATILSLCKITLFVLIFMSVISHVVIGSSSPKKLQIGVKKRPAECPTKSKKGDLLHMHYTVTTRSFYIICNITMFGYHEIERLFHYLLILRKF